MRLGVLSEDGQLQSKWLVATGWHLAYTRDKCLATSTKTRRPRPASLQWNLEREATANEVSPPDRLSRYVVDCLTGNTCGACSEMAAQRTNSTDAPLRCADTEFL